MLITLSPSKTLNETPQHISYTTSIPKFLEHTAKLSAVMKTKTSEDLQNIMRISENLGDLNVQRFQEWNTDFSDATASPALWTFLGDVYRGFELDNYTQTDVHFAEDHIRILSGFYGLLTPLSLIKPYRLEMGTRMPFYIESTPYKNLYEYWGDILTKEMNTLLEKHKVWINLASVEYSKVIQRKKINGTIIDIDFKVLKNGTLKTIGIFAKQQRGRMANWIVQEKIDTAESLHAYTNDGFRYDSELSTDQKMIFVKK